MGEFSEKHFAGMIFESNLLINILSRFDRNNV